MELPTRTPPRRDSPTPIALDVITSLRCFRVPAAFGIVRRADRTDAAQARAVWLEKTNATGLQVVLEDDSVGNVLSQSKRERCDSRCQGLMGEDVVRVSGFFDPKGTEGSKLLAGDERLWEAPLLIRVKHNRGLIARHFAKTLCTRQLWSRGPPTFNLNAPKPASRLRLTLSSICAASY
jgi:hypothetical protein